MAEQDEVFGESVFSYSRADAIRDGLLHDLTSWAASPQYAACEGIKAEGFHGGFSCPVAVTASVWSDVLLIPADQEHQDVRGRAHDLLWMANLAARRAGDRSAVEFEVIMDTGDRVTQRYRMHIGGGDNGEPVVTIMQLHED